MTDPSDHSDPPAGAEPRDRNTEDEGSTGEFEDPTGEISSSIDRPGESVGSLSESQADDDGPTGQFESMSTDGGGETGESSVLSIDEGTPVDHGENPIASTAPLERVVRSVLGQEEEAPSDMKVESASPLHEPESAAAEPAVAARVSQAPEPARVSSPAAQGPSDPMHSVPPVAVSSASAGSQAPSDQSRRSLSGSSMRSDYNTMTGWIRARLTAIHGPASGRTWYLHRAQSIVGRDLSCDVILDDACVSQRHCQIVRDEDGFRVADMGSVNGVYVNGRIAAQADLVDGDVLRVGESAFRYTRVGGAAPRVEASSFLKDCAQSIFKLASSGRGLVILGSSTFLALLLSSALVRGVQTTPTLDISAEAVVWVQNARRSMETRDWRRARDELAIAGALDFDVEGVSRLRRRVILELDNALTIRLIERATREENSPNKLTGLLAEIEMDSVYRSEAERLRNLGVKRYVKRRLAVIAAALDRGDKKNARRESDALEASAESVDDIKTKIDRIWKSRGRRR